MTNITLMHRIAQEMRQEGWQDMGPQERVNEHMRRYHEAMNGHDAAPPSLADVLAGLTGASAEDGRLAIAILERIGTLNREIDKARNEVEFLESQERCNGWTHVNAAGALYVHHSSRKGACPLHGAEIKDRGRVYVGQRHERQMAATTALANHNAWEIAKATLRDLEQSQRNIRRRLFQVAPEQLRLFGGDA